MVAVGVQGLRPLLTSRVAGLVGMPGLFAVVAELGTAAFSATNQPGTAGTARGDDGKAEGTGEMDGVVTEEETVEPTLLDGWTSPTHHFSNCGQPLSAHELSHSNKQPVIVHFLAAPDEHSAESLF